MMKVLVFFAAMLVGGLLLTPATTNADLFQFDVVINAAQEVPTNGSAGTGLATVLFDSGTGQMDVNGTFTGLTSNVTVAHIHGMAAPGANAGVLFGLTPTGTTSGTISGTGTIVGASNIADVLNGLSYINIHTSQIPAGEIRGQLANPTAVPEPCMLGLGGAIGLLGLRRRRRI